MAKKSADQFDLQSVKIIETQEATKSIKNCITINKYKGEKKTILPKDPNNIHGSYLD